MDKNDSFIGTGWDFPPAFDKATSATKTTSGIEDIEKSLEIIFSTALGERIMNPKFGCSLHEYVFDAMNESLLTYIKEILKTAILYHEPRIDADVITVIPKNEEGILEISIEYIVRGTNSRFNTVYPYYIKESNT